jgi:hypothetical protein
MTRVETCTILEKYLLKAFFASLNASLTVMFIYSRYKRIAAEIITLHMTLPTNMCHAEEWFAS